MKSKFSYKSKRTIIIAAIITVLLAGTATGVYFFTKGNAQAQAAGDNNTTQEQYGDAPEENKNEQQNNTTENEQNKNEQGETTPNQQEEQETERQEQTTNNNQTTQNEQTTTTTTGEVPNQEYVTEREETVKNPWETLEVGWGPTQFASIASTANLTAKKSNLEIHKTVDKESVKIGDTLTYTISVKNNGDKVAKAIIYDNVPEGTVLLNKDNNEDENTKKLTWRVTVEPGETENVEFTVRVKAEKGTIKNSAIVNGKTTNETETGIINITGKKEVNTSEAKAGDTLTYTITLTNSGNATGTVTVTDNIPDGTTLVADSITANGSYNEENKTITWTDVKVEAGKTAEVSFKATINSDTKTSVRNTAVIDDNKPTEEVETKVANITTTKTSVGIRNGSQLEAGATLHEFDVIKYTLTATNTGNGNGSVVLEDTVPEGTTLVASSIKVDGKGKYTEADLNSGITVEVAANSTVTLTFQVKVNKLTTAEVHIKNENAKQDDTPINPTDDKVKKEYVTVTANKEWVDFDGVDGMRPESVEFELVADGTPTNNKQTASKDNWTVEFSNLDKYTESGNIIEYTIQENNVNEYYTPSYEVSKNGDITTVKVTNTLIYEKIKISVEATKTWVDKDNKVGVRPENIKFALYADGVATGKTETLSGTESTWTTTFENLDKYKSNGETIVYTVKEAETPVHYTKSEDGLTVTNTIDYTTFTKAVTVNKVWQKPASVSKVPDITINLYQNNNTLFSTQTLKNGATSAEFTNLPKYDENGDEYTYTAQEGEVTEYNTSYSEDKLTITNKIKQDTSVRVSVIKTWVTPDVNNVPEITINLLKNGTEIAEKILKAGTTTYTFENLEKYMVNSNGDYVLDDNGNVTENVYTVTEDAVEGYTSVQNGTNFTNTINQEKLSVSGNKTWVTPDASKVPDITINLLRDGTEIAEKTLKAGTTAYEFTDLDKYAPDGHIYTYTVTEDAVEGYASVQNGTNFTNTVKQEKLSVSGTKTWVGTPAGVATPDITINLFKDGVKESEVVLESGNTTYSFENLDKYDLTTGKEYKYTITENKVQNYETSYKGYNITNTFKQEITGEIKVTKTSTSTTKISNPLDVVFVLDVSGSMRDNSKYANMVDAVNSAISTIMNKNADSRVGIVTFSGDSTNLLELGSYTPNEKDKYLKASKYKISTNVSNYNKKSVNVTGGTYTQSGIKAGADLLTNASTTYTTTINGKETTLTRTPVLILLSDGLPTYYTNSYEGQLGRRNGDGSDTNLEESYYTIRTADYYKKQITNHYYAGTSNESKFYTIGFDLEGTLEETILNPTEANVNKCDAEGNGRYGNRNVRGKLYDRIIKDGKSAGAYSYADGSYTGKMSTADLENIFNQIINQTSTSTETRSITVEESNARKVELTNIDTNKAFSLTINSTTYSTFARAVDAGYVKGDETSGYYVDLSTVAEGSIVSIEYNEK